MALCASIPSGNYCNALIGFSLAEVGSPGDNKFSHKSGVYGEQLSRRNKLKLMLLSVKATALTF